MGVKLADVINNPEIFEKYVINKTMEKSALLQSGIVENNEEFDKLASQSSQLVNMPFYKDLSGDAQDGGEDTDLVANGIASGNDVATIFRRQQMWSATDLASTFSGTDPMKVIGDLVANYWQRELQKDLISTLKGVFASDEMAKSHVLDVTKAGTKDINPEAFIDACQLLGDAQNQLTGVIMHSATWSYLRKQNLIQTVTPSNDVSFETYQGKRVIIDDGVPNSDGTYTTYLFGNGAIALGNGNPVGHVAVEVDRDKRKASGIDYLINRKVYLLHPRGVAFQKAVKTNVASLKRDEMEKKQNWKQVYEPKQIRMVALIHKLSKA